MATKISSFDADAFLNTGVEGANSTKTIPVPEGDYRAVIEDVKSRAFSGEDGPMVFCDVLWKIDDPDHTVRDITKREKNIVRQGVRIDVVMGKDGSFRMDMTEGTNAGLGRLRAAIGQNTSSGVWNFGMLKGAMATITVSHRTDKETGDTFTDVRKVAALA